MKMTKGLRVFLCLSFLIVSGCGAALETAQPTVPRSPTADFGPWSILFHMTGGPSNMDRELTLDDQGSLTVTDGMLNSYYEAQVPPDRLSKLSIILDAELPNSSKVETPMPMDELCEDCFYYQLTIERQDMEYRIAGDEAMLDESGYSLIIAELKDLMELTLTGKLEGEG